MSEGLGKHGVAKDMEVEEAKKPLSTGAWIGISAVALVAGLLIGTFVLSGVVNSGSAVLGKATLSESDLDSVVATYTYGGQNVEITAKDVIQYVGYPQGEDGSYNVPSASEILSCAQDKLLLGEAEKRGITVTDDEVAEFAIQTIGESDFSVIASYYGLSEEEAKVRVSESAMISKLQNEVVSTEVPAGEPAPPAEPESGDYTEASPDYAEYIIGLVGDEWDSASGTWARTDGAYYAALADYDFTNESATYEAAEAAYNVAFEEYAEVYTEVTSEWEDFVRGIASKATIKINTMAS